MVLLASDLPKTLSENGGILDLDLRMFLPKWYLYFKSCRFTLARFIANEYLHEMKLDVSI